MKKNKDNVLWIFLHVPKTGGTTFSDQIKKYLKTDEYIDTSQVRYGIIEEIKEKQNIRVLLGHATYYGIHRFFPDKEPRYIVFFRDPAERLVSSYNFEMRTKTGKNLNFWKWYKLQAKNEVVHFMDLKFHGNPGTKVNIQSKYLKIFHKAFFSKKITYIFQNIYKKYLDLRTSNEKMDKKLNNSKKLLEKTYYIGYIPELNQDLKILFKQIHIPTSWQDTNVTPKDQKKFQLTPNIRNKLYKDNKYDKALFDYALSLRKNKTQPS